MPLHRGPIDEPVCHFTTYDVAFFLHVSAPTARKWIKIGLIKGCFQLPESNEWRVPAIELLAFAEERKFPIHQIMIDSAVMYMATYVEDGSALRKDVEPPKGSSSTKASSESYANKVIPVK